jgi:hypothetical protein
MRPARVALAAVGGGAVCLILDHLHATHGVLWYPRPVLWDQAWWVFPLFATATVAVLAGARLVRRLFRGAVLPSPTASALVGDALAFVTAYASTSFFHASPTALALVLGGFWAARVALGMPGWVVVFCLLTALVGPAVEATISATGAFFYHHPDVVGVTRWLPPLYLFVGVVGVQLERLMGDGDGGRE